MWSDLGDISASPLVCGAGSRGSMSSTVFDSSIFRDLFGTPAMRTVFNDQTQVERYVVRFSG